MCNRNMWGREATRWNRNVGQRRRIARPNMRKVLEYLRAQRGKMSPTFTERELGQHKLPMRKTGPIRYTPPEDCCWGIT